MSGFLCSMVGVSSAAAAVVNNAVSFDGTNDFYQVTGLTTTATDSKYLTIAFTWFHASGANSRNQTLITARLGTTSGENGWEVCLQSGRFRYVSPDNSGSNTDMVYGDYEGPTENAYNQIVAYVDHTSFANCKYYLNGVDRTSNLLNGAAVGAVNLGNNNINWGSSNVTIKIGEDLPAFAGTSGFSDFLGRISQIYVHNASGAPTISNYWNSTSGLPIDLGTNGTASGLAQPLIYHYGDTTTFPTNNGTGFNAYTLTATGDVVGAAGPTYGRKAVTVGRDGTGAAISTTQSKFGGASLRVSYSGSTWDYLQITGPSSLLNFGNNDWTVEGWFRFDNTNTDAALWTAGPDLNGDFDIRRTDDNLLRIGRVNTAWDVVSGSTGIAANTWYHIAFAKSGGTARIYVDGTEVGSASNAISYTMATQARIGSQNTSGLGLAGYIDEFRVSKTARYTAGFTAPAAAFVNDANTLLLLHMDGTDGSTTFTDDSA